MDIVCFRQEQHWYGLLAGTVVDLLPAVRLATSDPTTPFLYGITRHHQRLILAIRIAGLLDPRTTVAPTRPYPAGPRPDGFLVAGHGDHLVGIPCDTASYFLEVEPDHVTPLTREDDGAGRALVEYKDHLVMLLDTARLLRLVDVAIGNASRRGVAGDLIERAC